jgi:hypothetical protein
MRPVLLFLLLCSVFSFAQSAPPAPRAEILILGTYHMGNPGHDLANIQADDVRAPKRQQELAELIEVLKKFNPTKIAIESGVGTDRRPQQYADYLAGKYTLTTNEIDQVGFRLAKELGHKKIYPVDEDGDFPFMRVTNYAKANGMADKLDALMADSKANVQAEDAYLKSHTILQMLERMNSDESAAKSMAWYMQVVRFSEPYEYAGADLLASWFQRNARIYSNIVKLADPAQERAPERILVIYGAGHLTLLRQLTAEDPGMRLRKLSDFTH